MNADNNYIVAGRQPWNKAKFEELISNQTPVGSWEFVGDRDQLSLDYLQSRNPRYIFFLHWSDKVPCEIIDSYECVCFHMTDVPYGRGGSPLQNLIVRGHKDTMLTALKMTDEFDAGPVYSKRPLSLEGSSAEEIYTRSSELSLNMAFEIAANEQEPVEQSGEAVIFKRRKPEDSRLPANLDSLAALHDFIRMLDAAGYPRAFIDLGEFRIEFDRSTLYHDHVSATAVFRAKKEGIADE